MATVGPTKSPTRLDSWKDIAAYLGCDIRTARRWEQERGLPVRRVPGGKRQSVFALTAELDQWLKKAPPEEVHVPESAPQEYLPHRKSKKPIAALTIGLILLAAIIVAVRWKTSPSATAVPPAGELALKYAKVNVQAAYAIAVADLNHDGWPDLIMSGLPSAIATVILNDGHGGLGAPRGYETCETARSLVAADFDGDGNIDIAFACGDARVSVFWGDGTGALNAHYDITLPAAYRSIAAGDFDGDGKPDLFISGPEALVMLSRGRTFVISDRHASKPDLTWVAVGDLNGDGKQDAVITYSEVGEGTSVQILAGDGRGHVRPLTTLTTQTGAGTIALADFDEDGNIDLAIGTVEGFEVFRADGHGNFTPSKRFRAGEMGSAHIIAAADLDDDGHTDLVITDTMRTIRIFYGLGNGEFSPPVVFTPGGAPAFAAVADFNHDGKPDIAFSLPLERAIGLALAPFPRK